MQDYTYTSTSSAASTADYSGLILAYFVFLIVIYLVFSFILSKVFAKAGKPGWAAFVPIYNGWVMFEIGGKPGWYVLLGAIPFAGPIIAFILYILVSLEIAKRFGKSSVFGIFGLWLFSLVGYSILAFDGSSYKGEGGPVPAKASSPAAPVAAQETKNDDTPASPPLVQ